MARRTVPCLPVSDNSMQDVYYGTSQYFWPGGGIESILRSKRWVSEKVEKSGCWKSFLPKMYIPSTVSTERKYTLLLSRVLKTRMESRGCATPSIEFVQTRPIKPRFEIYEAWSSWLVWHTPYLFSSPSGFWVLGFDASVYFLLVLTVVINNDGLPILWRIQSARLLSSSAVLPVENICRKGNAV